MDDPATAAARRLDWRSVMGSLDTTTKAVLIALVGQRVFFLTCQKEIEPG